jgi:hypothetical protein
LGSDFASDLYTSFPLRCRRQLGDQFGTMLRQTAKPWFHIRRRHVEQESESTDVQRYLEWFEAVQRRAMYDLASKFTRAAKEADHDLAAFGQCAISVEMNRDANGLLYRCWHLRDMAWQEGDEGTIDFVVRKWKPTAQTLVRMFPGKVHRQVNDLNEKTPFETVECLHIVCPANMYDKSTSAPRWSIYYDVTHNHLMLDTPLKGRYYIIPRWQTVSDSQYSYSPATVIALPDARLLQAMTLSLLEAGEKAANPPIIATKNVVKSDLSIYAGGVTWVERDYDERLGSALRPLEQDLRGFPHGLQMNADVRQMLNSAFFLDALTLPQRSPEMTAFEVGQRVQEYIRNALPIFEPIEQEYNGAICDETFELLLRGGAFGAPGEWPKELRGAEVDFAFSSPLHDIIEEQKGQKFQQAQAIIGAAVALDPSLAYVPNVETAMRDALQGMQIPATWVNSQEDVAKKRANAAAQQAAQQKLATMVQGSEIMKNVGASGLVPQNQPAPV